LDAWVALIEASALGRAARGGDWLYPLANLAHLLGLVLLVGGIGIVDLRLAGVFRALPLPALSRALTPLALGGLVLLGASGAVLFAADARSLAHSVQFRAKLVLIALALANAGLFRLWWRGGEPGRGLRAMALLSLAAWLAVATLGRLIAYT
jgi:hypothetical protein